MDLGSVETLVMTAGTALTASVGYLFKLVMSLSVKQAEQGELLGEFRGRQEGISQLAAQVIEAVTKAVVVAQAPPGQSPERKDP